MKDQKAFFPISLGNHYYTNNGLVSIRETISIHHEHCIVVICDHLRDLSYSIRGLSSFEINGKLEKEVSEFENRLINCGYDDSNIEIVTMSSLVKETLFENIQRELFHLIRSNESLFEYLNELSMYTLDKNRDLKNINKQGIQSQYFISESSLSIYVTEVLGYENEYYKQFDRGLIVILYKKYSEYIRSIINKVTLERKFRSLKEILL